MESEARYATVGLAIIILSGLLVWAILWLSHAGSLGHDKHFSIYFRKHVLNGLQVNSDVTMRGIKVGSVTSLQISPRNIEEIQVNITVAKDTPVKQDTVALLNRNFLTGFSSLDLAKGTQEAPDQDAIRPGESYPVIPEGRTELEKIADSFPELVEKISELASRAHDVLSDENLHSLHSILTNIDTVSSSLAKNNEKFDSIFAKVDSAVSDLSKMSKSLSTFTSENSNRFDEISQEMLEGMQKFKDAIAGLDEHSTTLLMSLTNTANLFSQQVSATSRKLSSAADNASNTLESFEEPRKIISGPHKSELGPGEGSF